MKGVSKSIKELEDTDSLWRIKIKMLVLVMMTFDKKHVAQSSKHLVIHYAITSREVKKILWKTLYLLNHWRKWEIWYQIISKFQFRSGILIVQINYCIKFCFEQDISHVGERRNCPSECWIPDTCATDIWTALPLCLPMCTEIVVRDNTIAKIKPEVKKEEGGLWSETHIVGRNL